MNKYIIPLLLLLLLFVPVTTFAVRKPNIGEYETPNTESSESTVNDSDCNSLLGSPTVEYTPAYYLQIVFNVMKYAAIIILVVFSLMDYFSAIVSHDDDAINKSTSKIFQRLVLCIILFIFPTILEYVFTLINIYDPSTCGIR